MLVLPNPLGQAAPGVAGKGYSGARQTGWETMVDLLLGGLLWVLDILLGSVLQALFGPLDRRISGLLGYIVKCLEAARDWVEECIRERKLKQP